MAPYLTVVWSGANRRRYLGVESHPVIEPPREVVRAERRAAPRPQAHVSEAWLAGEHYREYDRPQQRLFYSVQQSNAPFTVPELAIAAKVSRTLARRYVEVAVMTGRCRPAGLRPVGRTRVLLFELVPRNANQN